MHPILGQFHCSHKIRCIFYFSKQAGTHFDQPDMFKLPKMYSKIHILIIICNQAFASSFGIPGMKICCTMLGLTALATLILIAHIVHPIVIAVLTIGAVVSTLLVGIMLQLAGKVHECSQFFKANFSTRCHKKESKIAACCQPLTICIGCLYPIKKITTLTYFSLYIVNLVNILIAFRSIKA